MLFKTMMTVCLALINVKLIFLVSFCSIVTYRIILLTHLQREHLKDLQNQAIRESAENVRYADMHRKAKIFLPHIKFILLWTPEEFAPYRSFEYGQKGFIKNKCPKINCYITDDRYLFGGDLKRFDAIMFNGRNLNVADLPTKRYNHQKYIYVNMESAQNYPVCNSTFDNYFNWTYTYKLNSDMLYLYIQVMNKDDEIVGPKVNVNWINTDYNIDEDILNHVKVNWKRKKHAAAWFVSHCQTSSKREDLAKQLHAELRHSNLRLSVLGSCVPTSCPRDIDSFCWKHLEQNYYFYCAFENSNCEDYVTEKLLKPLHHYIIPIVYGGANYSRFLPPGSYLDASKLSPKLLVAEMSRIIASEQDYIQYFKWRSVYKYTNAKRSNICGICSALYNKTMMNEKKTYKEFRKWWNPDYKNICSPNSTIKAMRQ